MNYKASAPLSIVSCFHYNIEVSKEPGHSSLNISRNGISKLTRE